MTKSWPVLLIVLSFLAVSGQVYAESGKADSTEKPAAASEASPAPVAAAPAAPVVVAPPTAVPAVVAVAPVAPPDIDDGEIRLTPDTTKIIKLKQDAASVIVTNQNNARVLLDTPRTLIIMPRTPGSTPLTVLNAKGETILQKNIIVTAAAKAGYVRIRRMCSQTGAGSDCAPTSFYYCPDGCYEVSPVDPTRDSSQIPQQSGGVVSTDDNSDGNAERLR